MAVPKKKMSKSKKNKRKIIWKKKAIQCKLNSFCLSNLQQFKILKETK